LRQAYDYWQDQPGNFCTRRGVGRRQGTPVGLVSTLFARPVQPKPVYSSRSSDRHFAPCRIHPTILQTGRGGQGERACVFCCVYKMTSISPATPVPFHSNAVVHSRGLGRPSAADLCRFFVLLLSAPCVQIRRWSKRRGRAPHIRPTAHFRVCDRESASCDSSPCQELPLD